MASIPRTAAAAPAIVVTSPDGAPGEDAEPRAATAAQASGIAPFPSWMISRDPDETTRRDHSDVVETYLAWCRDDTGPVTGRRRRYEDHLTRHAPHRLDAARAGLDRYAEYRADVARTLAAGGRRAR